MSSMQASLKELRTLKQEETTMVYLASKISDQLNRLKVEELSLQNHVRLQNEEMERKSRGSQRSINRSLPVEEFDNEDYEELEKGENSDKRNIVPLNLVVNTYNQYEEMEEEEEDDDEGDDKQMGIPTNTADHEDIEQFVNSL